ncbi:hypothetical protein ACRALDRAFT_2035274, partial [Sodiomyces alcalophilus JCM 7366]|uniref:uncharacterized protein n=1 Tax=Sodiomyces alcalophilus JCM 7366 TaxID=591952 RepID=UPI0039B4A6CB
MDSFCSAPQARISPAFTPCLLYLLHLTVSRALCLQYPPIFHRNAELVAYHSLQSCYDPQSPPFRHSRPQLLCLAAHHFGWRADSSPERTMAAAWPYPPVS